MNEDVYIETRRKVKGTERRGSLTILGGRLRKGDT